MSDPGLLANTIGKANVELDTKSPAFRASVVGAQQKSHAQYAENTFLQDDVDSVFRFSFDQMVSVFHGLLFTYW